MDENKNSFFSNSVSMGQIFTIIVPIVLLIGGAWFSIQLRVIQAESENLILREKISSIKDTQDKQNDYIVKTFGDFQKTLYEIKLDLKDKKNIYDEKNK